MFFEPKTPNDVTGELLDNYHTIPNHALWDSINDNNISKFKSILNVNVVSQINISMYTLLQYIMHHKFKNLKIKRSFIRYIIVNDGNLPLRNKDCNDYSMLIAHCCLHGDIKTLKYIIQTLEKSRYDFHKKFTLEQLTSAADDNIDIDIDINSINKNFEKNIRMKMHANEKDKYDEQAQSVICWSILAVKDNIDENDNDNKYKCFEYLVKEAGMIANDEPDHKLYVRLCFRWNKYQCIKCFIVNNILESYNCVIINIIQKPQMWKLGILKMLLNDYTGEKTPHLRSYDGYPKRCQRAYKKSRRYSICKKIKLTQDGTIFTSLLNYCVNIGYGMTYVGDMAKCQSNCDLNKRRDAAFECFKIILECPNITKKEINTLVNTRCRQAPDMFNLIEICVCNSHKDSRFIDYLISNNGKFNWTIDYSKTNALQIASLIGDYVTFNKIVKNVNSNVDIKKFGYIPCDKNGCIIKKPNRLSDFNQFNSLTLYHRLFNNSHTTNMFFWCIMYRNSCLSDIVKLNNNCQIKRESNELELLCFGYCRNSGIKYPANLAPMLMKFFDCKYGNIQCFKYLLQYYCCYYDNGICSSYQDTNDETADVGSDGSDNDYNYMAYRLEAHVYGYSFYDSAGDLTQSENEHEEMLTSNLNGNKLNNVDNISLYPTIIFDCVNNGRVDILKILFEQHRQENFQLRLNNSKSIDSYLKYAFYFACYIANYSMLKHLLTLMKRECQDFDINDILNPFSILTPKDKKRFIDTNNYDQDKQLLETPLTPLVLVTLSSRYSDSLQCLKLLLSQPNINIHKIVSNKSAFLICVEKGKDGLVQCLIDKWDNTAATSTTTITGNNNNNNNNDCLFVAISRCNVSMLQLLIENISKIFGNDENEIEQICKDLLDRSAKELLHVSQNYYARYYFYKVLVCLLNASQLIKNKKTGQRFIVPTENLINICLDKNEDKCLNYLLQNFKDSPIIQQMKQKIEQKINQNCKAR